MKKMIKIGSMIIFIGVALLFIVTGIRQVVDQHTKIMYYRPAFARIISSDVVPEVEGEEDTNYRPAIEYTYEAEGRLYRNNVVTPLYKTGSYGWAEGIAEYYEEGFSYVAQYNPENPAQSFLVRSVSFSPYLSILFPMILIIYVVSLLSLDISKWRRRKELKSTDEWKELLIPNAPEDKLQMFFYVTTIWVLVGVATLGHYFLIANDSHEDLATTVTFAYAIVGILLIYRTLKYFRNYKRHPQLRLFADQSKFSLGDSVKARLKIMPRSAIQFDELTLALICNEINPHKEGEKELVRIIPRCQQSRKLIEDTPLAATEEITVEEEFHLSKDCPPTTQKSDAQHPIQWQFQINWKSDKTANVLSVPIEVTE